MVFLSMLLLSLLPLCSGGWFLESVASNLLGFHEGDTCQFTREQSLQCLVDYVDLNHDGQIEESEFDYAKSHYLPPAAQRLERIAESLGFKIPFSQLLRDCDPNHDGILTSWDWMHSQKTCLPTQGEMCKLKTICDRARKIKNK